ncbi:MAG: porin family protein [Proteobacteria bacterium]|nr:porin family protein [Pseudomonadota bacterium]
MKLLFGAAAAVALLAGGSAMAQTAPVQYYGTIGYTQASATLEDDGTFGQDIDLDAGAITGRLGARFGQYVGVEGEVAFGVTESEESITTTFQRVPVTADINYKINGKAAVYGVGFLPVSPNADLFGRIGVGRLSSEFDVTARAGGFSQSEQMEGEANFFAFGGGGQYFFDGLNGVRGEYTRFNLDTDEDEGAEFDSFSISYVRKF